MTLREIILFLFLFVVLGIGAQSVKKVRGEVVYRAPESMSIEEAKRTALEYAKIQLIADEFGTLVSESNISLMENKDGNSSSVFHSLSSSEVKGEWIETTEEPVYQISFEQNILVVKVAVAGRVREVESARIDCDAKILCNGTEARFEQSDFKSGDELFLRFSSPVDGFLTVYLLDSNRDAYCLLPYQSDPDGKTPIVHGREYVFFSQKEVSKDEQSLVDEYVMTCDNDIEHNQIYIIFSPNNFTKALDQNAGEGLPRMLSYEDFQKWLAKCRRHDIEMTTEVKSITIKK